MPTTDQNITAEELLTMSHEEPCELIAGEIVMMTPAGCEHGQIVLRIGGRLLAHVEKHKLGYVLAGEAGFLIARDPDTVRVPDVAFIRADRQAKLPKGFFPGPPDLAVEVISPTDRPKDIDAKTQAWLDAGTPLVWVVSPEDRTVTIHCPGRSPRVLLEQDPLTGEDVLPSFKCPVADFFGVD